MTSTHRPGTTATTGTPGPSSAPTPLLPTEVEVAVIGGGQAGLATAYELGRRGLQAVVLDAAPVTGHSWRTRWDSLRLFTPASHSSLPGLPFPAAPDHHPHKDEVADYLCDYVDAFELDVRHHAPVDAVDAGPDGGFEITVAGRPVAAAAVVVATGPFQTPGVPALAERLDDTVLQLHSSAYRNPAPLPAGGTVVVVGAGNSGVQIAAELAPHADVHLAVGREAKHVPQRLLGRDLFWWLTTAGMLTAAPETRRGQRMQKSELVIGTDRRALHRDVTVHGRLTGVEGDVVSFEGGATVRADAVVWATGYRSSHRFVRVPGALDARGLVDQTAGVGRTPGLFTVGQPWQRNRGSALLGFVGADAALVADAVADAAAPPFRLGAGRDAVPTARRQRLARA